MDPRFIYPKKTPTVIFSVLLSWVVIKWDSHMYIPIRLYWEVLLGSCSSGQIHLKLGPTTCSYTTHHRGHYGTQTTPQGAETAEVMAYTDAHAYTVLSCPVLSQLSARTLDFYPMCMWWEGYSRCQTAVVSWASRRLSHCSEPQSNDWTQRLSQTTGKAMWVRLLVDMVWISSLGWSLV